MSIAQKIESCYKNQIENIKKEKNPIAKIKMVGALVLDVGNRCISAVAESIHSCRHYVKKCSDIVKYNIPIISNKNKCGNKKYEVKHPEIVAQIKEICENTENVDKSLRDDITYVDVTAGYVSKQLKNKYEYSEKDYPCENTIIRIMKQKLGYKITKVKKNKVLKKIPETDAIFENVNARKEEVKNSRDDVIAYSIDDKATKLIGNLSDNGSSWIEKESLDHDTMPKYRVKPFGMLNLKTNNTAVFCATSNSTADFKVDCIKEQLKNDLKMNSNIKKVYLFLDNGPENNSRRTLWIWSLINLAIELNITIELVYYPPYHSKYNPIEHFWGVLQRSSNGLIINSLSKLVGSINGTKWHGINAKGILIDEEYHKGVNVDKDELKKLIEEHIHHENKGIEKWSLIITP